MKTEFQLIDSAVLQYTFKENIPFLKDTQYTSELSAFLRVTLK